MNTNSSRLLGVTLAAAMALLCGRPGACGQQPEQPAGNPPPMPTEEFPAGSQVLTSGPVHEAFAKPVLMDPQAPVAVPNEPPANLPETPPAEKPADANIVWVPGYWAWDAERNDFLWVSGCWRNAPPNTYWVPGHWLQAENGWQWIAGFWKSLATQPQQEIEYLPAPPAAVEVGPPGAPPQPDQVWVPGCWYWLEGRYVPRHGYWITPQTGWVWVPSHYAWTPRGYIFCTGHWDYDMDNRGVLFTPVYFPPEVRLRAGFVFSPSICVDLGMLRLNLFTYPRYRHYYFGDYYDDAYQRAGIYPWFKCQSVHTWYDPLFVYDRWHVRRADPHWADNQAREYALRRSNRDLRPARTYSELQVQMTRLPANRRPERPLVASVKKYAASQSTPIKFERITTAERQQIAVKSAQVRQLRDQRNRWEGPATTALPMAKHGPVVEAKPARAVTVAQPVERQATRPFKPAKQPAVVPPQPVRATQPERVVVSNPPRAPKPSDSRYIQKEPPTHPLEEHTRMDTNWPRGSSARDAQRKTGPGDSQKKDPPH